MACVLTRFKIPRQRVSTRSDIYRLTGSELLRFRAQGDNTPPASVAARENEIEAHAI